MKSVAIYSDGPSLLSTWESGYDVGLCINRAANKIPSDEWQWLVGGDLGLNPEKFSDIRLPTLGYCSMRPRFNAPRDYKGIPIIYWDTFSVPSNVQWSITAAVYFALHLEACTIDIYGRDQTDDGARYTDRRRASEDAEMRAAVDWCNERGVPIRSMTTAGCVHLGSVGLS